MKNNAKKIVFVVSRFLDGGIDTVLVEYLKNICKYTDYDVSLVIGLYMDNCEVFLSRIPNEVNVHYLVKSKILRWYKLRRYKKKRNVVLSLLDEILLNPIRTIVRRYRLRKLSKDAAVVIDFDCTQSSCMDVIPQKIQKITWIHFSIGYTVRKHYSRLKYQMGCYDTVVLISDDMKVEAEKYFPEMKKKFVRIYNAVDSNLLYCRAKEKVNDLRIKDKYIVAVERLEESQKDVSTLIRAYKKLSCDYNSMSIPKLYILGEGQSRNELEQLITELKLKSRVELIGFVDNPYPWMKNAMFVVHSSRMEGFGMSLVESIILEKLVISTDCPVGPREILDNGNAGVLVPVGDVAAFASAMGRFIKSPDAMFPYIENARKHAKLFMPDMGMKLFKNMVES